MMNQENLVSIIIPVYNAEQHIAKCLKSILRQTYKNIELIIVNDGSTDNSLEICHNFQKKDNRIKIITIENSGPSKARNIGLKTSAGSYIQFVDADDYVEDTITQRLVASMMDNYQLVICGYNIIFNNKKIVNILEDAEYKLNEFLDIFCDLYKKNQFQYLWNKIYSASIIKSYNISFNEETKRGEDALFNIDYLEKCSVILIINEPLYNYVHYNSLSLTRNYNKSLFIDQKRVFLRIINLFVKHSKYINNEEKINKIFINKMVSCFDNLYAKSNKLSSCDRLQEITIMISDKSIVNASKYYKGKGFKWLLLKYMMIYNLPRGVKLLYDIKYIFRYKS